MTGHEATGAGEPPAKQIAWRPSVATATASNVALFTSWLAQTRGQSFATYEELWEWSTTDLQGFWGAVWDYFDVRADEPPTAVLGRQTMPGAQWFPGSTLNFARHLLRHRDNDETAIQHASELRELDDWTNAELGSRAASFAAGLRDAGVVRGDRVAGYLPNIPEAIAAFLGCAAIGAVWSCCSPDFGVHGVVARLSQIEPKVLVATDGYRYAGVDRERLGVIAQLQDALPSIQTTVLIPYLSPRPGAGRLPDSVLWDEFGQDGMAPECEAVPFDHPLWIVYSSGTTGPPKAIVHSHGGVLLEQLMWLHLHADCRAGDRLFWFTTTGWVMWNNLISALLTPASIVLYDGDPAYPEPGTLWDLAAKARVTMFGTSPAYLEFCERTGLHPRRGRKLGALRAVGYTGSPLTSEGFEWVYRELGPDIWLYGVSGGTEVVGPLLAGVPTVPVVVGEIAVRALGAAVAAWDEAGEPLVNEVGELVLTRPIPSMPVCFWGEQDGRRYHDAYFKAYPGVWRHGDWLKLTPGGSGIISGRSDATINRGGIRMGTSEIYRSVLGSADVLDALVVDVSTARGGAYMPLFIVLADGVEMSDRITADLALRIRTECSPRHVPNRVFAVQGVPRTHSGKRLEVPVKRLLLGERPVARIVARDSVANPEALDWLLEHAEAIMAAADVVTGTEGLTQS